MYSVNEGRSRRKVSLSTIRPVSAQGLHKHILEQLRSAIRVCEPDARRLRTLSVLAMVLDCLHEALRLHLL